VAVPDNSSKHIAQVVSWSEPLKLLGTHGAAWLDELSLRALAPGHMSSLLDMGNIGPGLLSAICGRLGYA
jgi:hypothetical protein